MRQNTNRTETAPCKPRSGDRAVIIRMKRRRSEGNPYRIIATLFRTSFSRIRLSILLSVVSRQQTIPNDAFGVKIRSDEQKQSRSRVLSEKSGRPKRSGPSEPTAPPTAAANSRRTAFVPSFSFRSSIFMPSRSFDPTVPLTKNRLSVDE